jgi:dUTP pyrophosphatase
MELRIKPVSDTAKLLYSDHSHYHEGDSGLDVYFVEEQTLGPHCMTLVDLQIQCEAVTSRDNTTNISYYLYPRSSISKTPLRMANSVGIIDAGYRGNLKVAIDNTSDDPYTIERGQRLFQICSPTLEPLRFTLVNELSQTSRGSGGFGSTDANEGDANANEGDTV